MEREQTEYSEKLVHKIQKPGNYPEDSIQNLQSLRGFCYNRRCRTGAINSLKGRFDDISPFHRHSASAILSELVYSKAGRDLVKFRNVEKERLEKDPSGIAFNKKNLSRESQRECSEHLDIYIRWKIFRTGRLPKRAFVPLKPISPR
jgi:hypothetical protein